jgi:phosphopantothenoylcysteine decarboxylase/phosphopantothenate--cysteine ligase
MKKSKLSGKTVVVGVTGSIAAYKAAELVSALRQRGARVYVLMTQEAKRFVGEATFQALSENEVVSDLFKEIEGMTPTHIRLAERAHAFVVAPATANILAKMRYGLADDIVSCVYLATRAPVVIAPAMNCHMWDHPAVAENLKALAARPKHRVAEPESGFLACGYEGKGRLAPAERILESIEAAAAAKK